MIRTTNPGLLLLNNQLQTSVSSEDTVMLTTLVNGIQYYVCGYDNLSITSGGLLTLQASTLSTFDTPSTTPISWSIAKHGSGKCGSNPVSWNDSFVFFCYYNGIAYQLSTSASAGSGFLSAVPYLQASQAIVTLNPTTQTVTIPYGLNTTFTIEYSVGSSVIPGNNTYAVVSTTTNPMQIAITPISTGASLFSFLYYPDPSIIKVQCCSGAPSNQYPVSFCSSFAGSFAGLPVSIPSACKDVVASYCAAANNADPSCVTLYNNYQNMISSDAAKPPPYSVSSPSTNWIWIIVGLVVLVLIALFVMALLYYLFGRKKKVAEVVSGQTMGIGPATSTSATVPNRSYSENSDYDSEDEFGTDTYQTYPQVNQPASTPAQVPATQVVQQPAYSTPSYISQPIYQPSPQAMSPVQVPAPSPPSGSTINSIFNDYGN